MTEADVALTAGGTVTANLQLGTPVNLLYGVKPLWTGTAEAMFAPPTPATLQIETTVETDAVEWGYPIVTLHADAQSLLSTLYDYQVATAYQDPGAFCVPAGPLALADADGAEAALAASHYVGLDLTRKGESYMLVRLRRSVGSVRHPAIAQFGDKNRDDYLTPEAQAAYQGLAAQANIDSHDLADDTSLTAEQADGYVRALYELGSHFVSSVAVGEVIFQVLAYPPDRFAELSGAFANDKDSSGQLTGINALNYQYYTTPVNTGPDAGFGYASQTGSIVAVSRDPQLAQTLAAHDWDDERYAGQPSIFQAFSPEHSVGHFLDQFRQITPITVGLAPVSDLLPLPFQAAVLTRLLKGALLQKYGPTVTVPFAPQSTIDWGMLFPQASRDWLSIIATPSIDIYQEIVDLAGVELINTGQVESFTVASMALLFGGQEPVSIPGDRITVASYILDTSANATVPVLTVSAQAMEALAISVGKMYGALMVAAEDGSRREVLLDGFRFADGGVDAATGRSTVTLAGDVVSPPSAATLAALVRDLQFSLLTAESRMWGRSDHQDAVRQLTTRYLEWLSSLVPADSRDESLAAAAAQAQYLAKAALHLGGYGVPVPYLTYESYKDFVASMVTVADNLSDRIRDYQQKIDNANLAAQAAKTAREINNQIKATGRLLTQYFGVMAQNQNDIAGYYKSFTSQRSQEYAKTVTDIAQLQASLAEAQDAVNQAVEKLKQAIVDWERQQRLNLIITIAKDVFTPGSAISTPSNVEDVFSSLVQMAQKIQKVIEVINALAKLADGTEGDPLADVRSVLQQLDQPLPLPTVLEWQEFPVNMQEALTKVPGDLTGPKADLTAAFTILCLRGQALVSARAKQAQILTDIYFSKRQQDINATQAQRLAALTSALHLGDTSDPEQARIDLVGLTGEVQGQLQQVLAVLAKTLLLQDGAVQFTYLGAPATIQKFDLISLKLVMAQQQASILNGLLNDFNPPPQAPDDPIEYRIKGVPVTNLTDGNVYRFSIQPSASEFWNYAMVRVDKVLVRVEGIASSAGGEYLATLAFAGDAFEDRDTSRRPIEFTTVDRSFGPYDYVIATGVPRFGDQAGAFDDKITKVTPFGTWSVSLPPTSINRGLTFAGPTVDVVLTFTITALLVPGPQRQPMGLPGRGLAAIAAGAAASGTTLDDLVDKMYDSEAVLNGWDSVFNVMEDTVNQFMAQQYQKKYQGQVMPIDISFCTGPVPHQGQWIGIYHKFHLELGGPLLQFQQNNHSFVSVNQIIAKATTQVGSKAVPADWDPVKASVDDPGVLWGPETTIDTSNKPYVQGVVALSQVQGLVNPQVQGSSTRSVVLDFARGSFTAHALRVSTDNAMLNLQLSNWFITNPVSYLVNTLDCSDITKLPAMTPTTFMLNVLTTNSGKNILQQFVTTNGTQRSNLTINVNEPVPDNYDCSLMINTKIMFESIFVQGFNQGSTNVTVETVDPGVDFRAWSARVAQGSMSGTVNFPKGGDYEYRINSAGNRVTYDIIGMRFTRAEGHGGIAFQYETKRTQDFEAKPPDRPLRHRPWKSHSVDCDIKMSGSYLLRINNSAGGTGKQTIQLQSTQPYVDFGGSSIKPNGMCVCDDHDLQIAVLDELNRDVPVALQAQMAGIPFPAISLFALESLLFPGGILITLEEALVPGDLLIVGTFPVKNKSEALTR